jgi:hypothetical protein
MINLWPVIVGLAMLLCGAFVALLIWAYTNL